MKTTKKILALVLAVVMMAALCIPAMAEDEEPERGKITITNATGGATYTAYKFFDLTYAGEVVLYTYTKTSTTDALYDALTAEDSVFALTETVNDGEYSVSLKDNNTAAEVVAFLKTIVTAENPVISATREVVADVDGALTLDDLDLGYYYIKSTVNTGAVITLDSTVPDVTVIDKNQTPSWDNEDPENPGDDPNPGKVIVLEDGTKVTENSANYGDTVNFNISVNAVAYAPDPEDPTSDPALVTYYYIKDTLGDGFVDLTDIAVTIYELDPTTGEYEETGTTLTEDVGYTMVPASADIETDTREFEITVPFAERYGANAKIEVTYSATVNPTGENVVLAGDGNPNTANFTWSIDEDFDPDEPPYDPEDPDPEDPDYPDPKEPPYSEDNEKETTTYVYALGILKTDEEGTPLTGATFSVNGIQTSGEDGVYIYTGKTANGGTDTVMETDDQGVLIIKGLAAGAYALKEVSAPADYNLLAEPITITATLESTSTYTNKITTYFDSEGNVISKAQYDQLMQEYNEAVEAKATDETVEVPDEPETDDTTVSCNVVPMTVVNKQGTELPSTGGIGTTLFIVFGSIAMLAAGVFLVTNKRMKKEDLAF